jgi:hypothetical protein
MPATATTVSTTILKSVPLFASFPEEQLRTLVTVVTRGFRFNRSSSIGFAPQLPGHFIGVPIGDQAEKESTTVDQSIETDSPAAGARSTKLS